jgi:hypothetical protein
MSTQALFTHCCVDPQQAVPHVVWPPAQLDVQALLLQTWLAWQVVVQFPQWVASDATQEPLQSSRPDWHRHWLFWQVRPPLQGMPQAPQLFESDTVFTHSVPQAVCPAEQLLPVVPPVPVELVPAVPGLPLVAGLVQAAARRAKPSKKSDTRAVFIPFEFPDTR